MSDSCGPLTDLSGGTPLCTDPPDHAAEELAIPANVRHLPAPEVTRPPRRRRTSVLRAVAPLTVRPDGTR